MKISLRLRNIFYQIHFYESQISRNGDNNNKTVMTGSLDTGPGIMRCLSSVIKNNARFFSRMDKMKVFRKT